MDVITQFRMETDFHGEQPREQFLATDDLLAAEVVILAGPGIATAQKAAADTPGPAMNDIVAMMCRVFMIYQH